jgi:hypothetical protein
LAGDEMNQYSGKEELQKQKEQTLAPSNSSGGGILNSIYTKMSGHPTCEVVLEKFEGRNHFTAGDDLVGRVIIKTSVDGQHIQHQGIRVSLIGMILQLPDYAATP